MNRIALTLLLIFSLILSSCAGSVRGAVILPAESQIYSDEDIAAAVGVIMDLFRSGWSGCTLKEIGYAGDERTAAYRDWALRNDADEVIVLLSSFHVGPTGGDGSLNPNDTYTGWMWILVRQNGGEWRHVDHGY